MIQGGQGGGRAVTSICHLAKLCQTKSAQMDEEAGQTEHEGFLCIFFAI